MLGALPLSEISCDRKARLLLPSSQARPPSSKHSFQRAVLNFTTSSVALLSSAAVRPSLATSMPPHIHSIGYAHALGSLMEWPSAWPNGFPLLFIARPTPRHSPHVLAYSKPASRSQPSR